MIINKELVLRKLLTISGLKLFQINQLTDKYFLKLFIRQKIYMKKNRIIKYNNTNDKIILKKK